MKDSSKPGLTFELKFTVPENKMVPHLYPESPESRTMPKVSYEK
jgi:fluoroacetyl-CoA thioesterase